MNNEIKKALEEINILGNTILDDTTYKPTINRRETLYNYIKILQQENERLKKEKDDLYLDNTMLKLEKDIYKTGYEELKGLLSSLQNGSENE